MLAIVIIAGVNGTFLSPFFDPFFYYTGGLARQLFMSHPTAILYFTSTLLWMLTLVVAGVPAALYERARGLRNSDVVSLLIWLIGVVILAGKSLLVAAGLE